MENECPLFQESPLQRPDPKATRELMDYILNKFQMISHFHQSFAEMGMNFKGFDVELNSQGFLSEHPGTYRYVSNHLQMQPAVKGNKTLKGLYFAGREVKMKSVLIAGDGQFILRLILIRYSHKLAVNHKQEPNYWNLMAHSPKTVLAYKDTLCSHSVLIYFNNKLIVTCIPTSKRVFMWQLGGA